MDEMPGCFSLFCDPQSKLNRARDQRKAQRLLRAHLFLHYIVYGRLQVTDSQILAFSTLRNLYARDEFIADLASSGGIELLLREVGPERGSYERLKDVSASLNHIPQDEITSGAIGVAGSSKRIRYWKFDDVSGAYTKRTSALISDPVTQRLHFGGLLREFSHSKLPDEASRLERKHFYDEFPAYAAQRGCSLRPADLTTVQNLASAYYYDAVPIAAGASVPVFDAATKKAISARTGVRRRKVLESRVSDLPSRIDERFYADALNELLPQDLYEIANSEAALVVRNFLLQDKASYADFYPLSLAFAELIVLIENAIIRRAPGFRLPKSDSRVRKFHSLAFSGGAALEGITSLLDVAGSNIPGLGIAYEGTTRYAARKLHIDVRETADRENKLAVLNEGYKRSGSKKVAFATPGILGVQDVHRHSN